MRPERTPDEEQRRIIEEPNLEVPLKVIAGAGSGKTFVLAHRFVWLVLEKGLPADRILALTFNDNAAVEMRTRIRRLLRRNGIAPPTTLWVHTFHSFAARILRENAYVTGRDPEPTLITEIEERLYLEGLLDSVFAGELAANAALAPAELAQLGVEKPDQLRSILLRLVREAKGRGLSPEDFQEEAVGQARRFWEIVPEAAEALCMDPDEIAEVLYERAAASCGRVPMPQVELTKSLTLPVRKLYFSLRPLGARSDTQALFDGAREAEERLIDAATEIYSLYLKRLEDDKALDFDGQISQAVSLLREDDQRLARHYREFFEYLLVDEFQDTSPNQLELVRLLARPRSVDTYARLLVVGDRKQSIYGWRNAHPENIDTLLPMESGATVDGVEVFRPLTVSYRLTEPIVEIANRAGQAAHREDPALTAGNPALGRVIFPEPLQSDKGLRDARRREADFIAEQIIALRDSGEISDLSEVAILMRSRSRFRQLKVSLERHGVLYQAQGGVGFFEHPLARDVLAWLQVLNNPRQDLYMARLLTRAPYALTDRELYLLLTEPYEETRRRRRPSVMEIVQEYLEEEAASGSPGGEASSRTEEERAALPTRRLQAFADDYRAFRDLALAAPAAQVLEAVWRHCAAHVVLTPSEERAAAVVRGTLAGVLEQVSGDDPAPLHELVHALDLYLADDSLELPVADQPVQGAVQIMTIHRAKGLGFPAVFVLGWNERGQSGPTYDARWGVRGIKVRGEDPKGIICSFLDEVSQHSTTDESLNLAYVSLTRGERVLGVTRVADKRGQPPRYPAAEYFEGVELVPAETAPEKESETPHVRLAAAKVLSSGSRPAPRLLRVSYSQLRRLEQCPRWWLLGRQAPGGVAPDEPTDEESGAQVGTRFHQFVAAHYRGTGLRVETEGLSQAEARHLQALTAAFLDSEWSRLTEPVAAEVPVSLGRRVGGLQVVVSGVVDVLLPQSGRVADFKTDREMSASTRADHALQMLIYQQALSTSGTPPVCLLVHARPEGIAALTLSEEELQEQASRLELLLATLGEYAAGEPAEARAGEHCRWCDFRELCTPV